MPNQGPPRTKYEYKSNVHWHWPNLPTALNSDSSVTRVSVWIPCPSSSGIHVSSLQSTSAEWNRDLSEVCRMEPTYQAIARLSRLPTMQCKAKTAPRKEHKARMSFPQRKPGTQKRIELASVIGALLFSDGYVWLIRATTPTPRTTKLLLVSPRTKYTYVPACVPAMPPKGGPLHAQDNWLPGFSAGVRYKYMCESIRREKGGPACPTPSQASIFWPVGFAGVLWYRQGALDEKDPHA
ncbi:hypothetical protein J3F83DRAFT_26500 [Trichoderma novae-zelandiae]